MDERNIEMDERNIFDALEASNNQLGQEEEHYEAESGTDTDEEEGQYTFLEAVNQSLAAEELSSDEEYVLTELGPVIHRFEESEATPTTSTDGQHTPDEVVDRSTPDVHQVLNDLQEDIAIPIHLAAKDGIVWSVQPGAVNKTPSKNVFRPPVRKFINCQTMTDPESAFDLLFTPTMVRDIVKYTNKEGRRVQQHRWVDTDDIEIQAFIGILIHLGALNQNIFPTELIWDTRNGNTLARSAMTRSRFLALSNRLRFDDKETRTERRNRDEFAPIRDMWEQVLSNMRRHYVPGPFITVDEQLIPWRGRCKFLQYLPSKPDKYGLKVFWACDAETNYPLVARPYLVQQRKI
ncbi:hypothetical protein EGW08_021902 [Elysia chlorotica]|uniref:PiggyBac transposable element-derived protein domain-containing protein n=1 Tax=Elysia chlorotica TaxID=188477 RepID=A0A433SME0_ELYCH|nr:hypothetical protein EGW08_021902 [Elysia chlorotica]